MSPEKRTSPRTFYLNEQHELARAEKERTGSTPKYVDINWAAKSSTITHSLSRARAQIQSSRDPAKESHYFLLAAPVSNLTKASEHKKKAKDGKVSEHTDFAKKHSRVFGRLGIDLLQVAEDGSAVVHMKPEVIEQLTNTARNLESLADRDKLRWATIQRFETIPAELRIDSDWLTGLPAKSSADSVIEFQPLLTRSEIDALIRAVVAVLSHGAGEAVSGTGTDFSGRQWLRGKITRDSLRKISETFFSVQSLHSPLISMAAAGPHARQRGRTLPSTEIDVSKLPSVGVLDTGVPADHVILRKYRRGSYTAPTSAGSARNPHACFVASRVVFGDLDLNDGLPAHTPNGSIQYYDINIGGISPGEIEDKSVYPALQAVVSTAQDVRVFNMSFDAVNPLESVGAVKRSELLALVQDLDNFIFQNDIIVVIAAGNSPRGLAPSTPYPNHFDAPEWALGHWARSFNSLTCGSFVARLSSGALVNNLGWPSPFCRVGPGLCDSPKPDFSASGGNATPKYQHAPGLGVWGLTPAGVWEDWSGTSFAAPLLARECALAFQRLGSVCERGTEPFAVTVKAFLALTAMPPVSDSAVGALAKRTLGRGRANVQRLDAPRPSSGVMIWQGVLEDDKDIARVQMPVPVAWLRAAEKPHLRLVVSWDPPVNAAAQNLWATRDVSVTLRAHPDARAQRASKTARHGSYPVSERIYDLQKLPDGVSVSGDTWLLDIAYEQTAEYHAAMAFPPQQRVAFAAELVDYGSSALSPQTHLQALPNAETMNRLSVPATTVRQPIILRTRT